MLTAPRGEERPATSWTAALSQQINSYIADPFPPHSSPFLLQPHPPFHLGRSLNFSKLSCLLSTLSPTTGPSILPLLTLGTLVRAPQQSLWSPWCLSRAGTWSSPAWSAWLATSRGTVCPSWRDLPDWSHSLSPSTGLTSVIKIGRIY